MVAAPTMMGVRPNLLVGLQSIFTLPLCLLLVLLALEKWMEPHAEDLFESNFVA